MLLKKLAFLVSLWLSVFEYAELRKISSDVLSSSKKHCQTPCQPLVPPPPPFPGYPIYGAAPPPPPQLPSQPIPGYPIYGTPPPPQVNCTQNPTQWCPYSPPYAFPYSPPNPYGYQPVGNSAASLSSFDLISAMFMLFSIVVLL